MNILFVTHHFLCGNGGGVFASRAYINAFADLADGMTLLYPMKKGMEAQYISDKVKKVPIYYEKSKIAKLIALYGGKVHRYSATHFSETISKEKFDIVVFDSSLVSFRLIEIARKQGLNIITIHHNFQIEYFRDNSNVLTWLPWMFWTKRYESQAVNRSDLNLTLTAQDTDLLRSHYAKHKQPHFEVIGIFEFDNNLLAQHATSEVSKQNRFVITGDLGAKQTEESLLPWLKTYYPILQKHFPDSTLTIAGKSPSDKLKQECGKHYSICLIDTPVDMQPILNDADYYICPICLGGGLKLRIMDGLKSGLIVLTHTVSARGYNAFSELNYLYNYHDEETFEKGVLSLKQNHSSKNEIIESYQSMFSLEAGKERLKKILQSSFTNLVCNCTDV